MSRRCISVRTLSPFERRALNKQFRHPADARTHERALAIRLSSQGLSPPRIAEVVGRGRATIWRWISDFNTRGLAALHMGKSPGAPPKADEEVRAAIGQAVDANPQDLGYPFTRWTAALLAEHIRRTVHTTVCEATVYRVLHRLGYQYRQPKLDLGHRQDATEVRRAKREKAVAQKKSKPAPVVILSRFSTKQNFI